MNDNNVEIAKRIDILEQDIQNIDPALLKLLLKDKTTRKNILWGTKDYIKYGAGFEEYSEIMPFYLTGLFATVIQPRAAKSKKVQTMRIKSKAEVFTPSWICNEQNNMLDDSWFGRKDVFNTPNGFSWIVNEDKIKFPEDNKKNWKSYVDDKRLEITCGEAPYLVSRYDTTTGETIPLKNRIGLLDRKLRIVNENVSSDDEWFKWTERAFQSVYGYEFQGDSVLIARENLLYTFIDYYKDRFGEKPSLDIMKKYTNIIVWNIWQMDGLKYVVPYSCNNIKKHTYALSFFDDELEEKEECPGCVKNNIYEHTGIYCKIMAWRDEISVPFISLLKEEK